jgi:hypothetical protein
MDRKFFFLEESKMRIVAKLWIAVLILFFSLPALAQEAPKKSSLVQIKPGRAMVLKFQNSVTKIELKSDDIKADSSGQTVSILAKRMVVGRTKMVVWIGDESLEYEIAVVPNFWNTAASEQSKK